ncbi:MAG: hypothetical protein JNL52_03390 [Flavobacteriales bacterium]|nr:hypothetical protein [Flavobacteriales bacterium]
MTQDKLPEWLQGLGSILLIVLIPWCWFLGMFSPMEGKVAFDPYIDTWYAPRFKPELESLIHIGQTRVEVIEILGQPLFIHPPGYMCEGAIRYDYTQDGGYDRRMGVIDHRQGGKDFAWHRFSVCFDDRGVVVDIDNGWSYD